MSRPTRSVTLAVACLMSLLLLAGCMQEPLTQEEAEARTETAMASFASAMSSRDGGDIKALKGNMEGASNGSGDDMGFGMSEMSAEMTMEWGRNGVVYAEISMDSGGFSIRVETWCTPTQTFVKWGGDVYESRASSGDSDEDLCRGFEDADFEEGMMFLDGEELEGLDKGEVVINDDGTITAVYTDPENGSLMTITIDTDGRVSRFEVTDAEASGVFDVTYGSRDTIVIPEATARTPATVRTDTGFDWQSDAWNETVSESPHRPPLAEMEARWVEEDWETSEKQVFGTFSLTGGQQTEGGLTFEYFDVDGDGMVSVGDRYVYEESAEGDEAGHRTLQLYDLWAEGYANESPIPAPGLVGLLAAIGVAMVLLRRRD